MPVFENDGSSLLPPVGFQSEQSLGWYRSGTSTMALSYGTLAAPVAILTKANAAVNTVESAGNLRLVTSDAQAVDRGPQLRLSGENGGLPTPYAFAVIAGRKENSTSGNYAGYLQLCVTQADSTIAEALRISSRGTVLLANDGVAISPILAFSSDSSLGFYRSGVQTIAQSLGTFDLTAAIASIGSLRIKSGANNSCGTAVLGSNGSVNVANTYVKTGDLIFLTDQSPGGTLGDLELGGIRNSSGFTIQSTSVTDTSTVGWLIIRPG